jgi:hypothetical protein
MYSFIDNTNTVIWLKIRWYSASHSSELHAENQLFFNAWLDFWATAATLPVCHFKRIPL